MILDVSLWSSLLYSALLALSFVLSLYLWRSPVHVDRDDPTVIKQRLVSVLGVCLLAPVCLLALAADPDTSTSYPTPSSSSSSSSSPSSSSPSFSSPPSPPFNAWIGLPSSHLFTACTLPVLLTSILFLGPILTLLLSASSSDSHQPFVAAVSLRFHEVRYQEQLRLLYLRNLVVAPLAEEFVFRACICSLLISGGWSFTATLFFSPALFGIAHLHHLLNLVRAKGHSMTQAMAIVLFQLFYTSLFGFYAAFLYLRTGHLLSCFLVHSFCNWLGFPDLGFLSSRHELYSKRYTIGAAFVIGMMGFASVLGRWTEPELYGGWIQEVVEWKTRQAQAQA